MPKWNWSMQGLGWKEVIGFTMAVSLLLEGPNYYSDLLRGITVGMFVMLCWIALAERHALLAASCVIFGVSAMQMTAFEPTEGQGSTGHVIARHVIVALGVVPLAWAAWYRHRQARSGTPVSHG